MIHKINMISRVIFGSIIKFVNNFRCASCFDCPSCQHALSTRATSVPSTELDPEGRATPSRKAFYLACGFCRWTSRDVAIKDQPVCEFDHSLYIISYGILFNIRYLFQSVLHKSY